jgi:16S rRNA (cytidine1402-2'-O)-methyltransferase
MTADHTPSDLSGDRTAPPATAPLSPGLYLVATPIGNLEDITYRAVRVLKSCDRILAEDTRHSRVLLDHFGVRKPLEPYHDFNKEKVTNGIVQRLKDGEAIALICDAGTPGIADPAFNLVKAALAADITVTSVPGPSALLTALTSSGLPTDRFAFENFPPKKSAQRLHKLEKLKARWSEDENHAPTLGFYVAPYQIVSFLGEIAQVFGPDLHVVSARELTKKFEEFRRGPVSEILAHFTKTTPRGEFVVLFHPQDKR